jgi:hypothetical protein
MHDIDRTSMETFEYDFESEAEGEGYLFNEAEVAELASELMEVNGEQELEQFLGDLLKKAASAAGSFMKSSTGKALGGILKDAAKKALPMVGGALGGWVGGDAGSKIGTQLAGMAGSKLGLELEGESEQFETAKDFVRMAADAAAKVAGAPQTGNVANAVRAAVSDAVKTHMPSLLSAPATTGGAAKGKWIRRGNKIVLLGV